MPLTPQNVTPASRRMIPAYLVFATWVGIVYSFDPDGRLARLVTFPVFGNRFWGLGFLAIAVLQTAGLLTHKRELYVAAGLVPMTVWMTFWSAVGFYGMAFEDTTFTAPAFPLLIAWATFVTAGSLERRET